MHHIFVENNILCDKIYINKNNDNENYIHLSKSLRINKNEKILITFLSNDIYDYETVVEDIDNDNIILKIEQKIENRELDININLFQCIPKQDKLETIIEKTVELGISKIFLVNSNFSIAKIDASNKNKMERLKKISKQASMQSKRHIIPEIKDPISFKQIINNISKNDINILFYEEQDATAFQKDFYELKNIIKKGMNINVIIGAEGGFSKDEIQFAIDNDIKLMSLGKRILRTETASITATSILMFLCEGV